MGQPFWNGPSPTYQMCTTFDNNDAETLLLWIRLSKTALLLTDLDSTRLNMIQTSRSCVSSTHAHQRCVLHNQMHEPYIHTKQAPGLQDQWCSPQETHPLICISSHIPWMIPQYSKLQSNKLSAKELDARFLQNRSCIKMIKCTFQSIRFLDISTVCDFEGSKVYLSISNCEHVLP